MSLVDWLVIASLVVSLLVVVSQIGLMRKVNGMEVWVDLLMTKATIEAELERRLGELNKSKTPYSKGSDNEH